MDLKKKLNSLIKLKCKLDEALDTSKTLESLIAGGFTQYNGYKMAKCQPCVEIDGKTRPSLMIADDGNYHCLRCKERNKGFTKEATLKHFNEKYEYSSIGSEISKIEKALKGGKSSFESTQIISEWKQSSNHKSHLTAKFSDSKSMSEVAKDPLDDLQKEYQLNLTEGCFGAIYLEKVRGIPVEIAKDFGVGYSKDEDWLQHKKKFGITNRISKARNDWKFGRITFPMYEKGSVINFQGRIVNANLKPEKWIITHDIFPGRGKTLFNISAAEKDTLYLCEAPLDALSLLSIGINAAASFGVSIKWELIKSKNIVLAFDNPDLDKPARDAIAKLSYEGMLRGHKMSTLPKSCYGGFKDLNAHLSTQGLDVFKRSITESIHGYKN